MGEGGGGEGTHFEDFITGTRVIAYSGTAKLPVLLLNDADGVSS